MNFLWDGIVQAWDLIISGDPYLWGTTWVTLKVAAVSTTVAALIGLPLGLLLGLGSFRGRGAGQAVANAGLGLPPVIVGLFLALIMFPASPLGRFRLLYTLDAVYIAQTVLALPIIIALTSSAVRSISPGLLDQARGFHAGRIRVWVLAVREARIGIYAGLIAAVGSALSEVGAVILVGGNIQDVDRTLASAALFEIDSGHFAEGVAIGIILLGLILVVVGALTFLQHRDGVARLDRRVA